MSRTESRQRLWPAYALGAVTVLAAGLLWQGLASPRPAYAQPFDAALQRNKMIEELQVANKKLAEMSGYLREIRDAQPDRKKDKGPKPVPKKP